MPRSAWGKPCPLLVIVVADGVPRPHSTADDGTQRVGEVRWFPAAQDHNTILKCHQQADLVGDSAVGRSV